MVKNWQSLMLIGSNYGASCSLCPDLGPGPVPSPGIMKRAGRVADLAGIIGVRRYEQPKYVCVLDTDHVYCISMVIRIG